MRSDLRDYPVTFPLDAPAMAPCELVVPTPIIILGATAQTSEWPVEYLNAAVFEIRFRGASYPLVRVPLVFLSPDCFQSLPLLIQGNSGDQDAIAKVFFGEDLPKRDLPFRITLTRPPITQAHWEREMSERRLFLREKS